MSYMAIRNAKRVEKSFSFFKLALVLIFFIAASVGAWYIINSLRSTDNRSSADSSSHGRRCTSKLAIKISATGLLGDAKDSVTETLDYKKYYIHVADEKGPCSTTFAVVDAAGKELQALWSWKLKDLSYGAYASNAEGIARIDFVGNFKPGKYPLRLKPAGTKIAPSNEVVLNLVASNTKSSNVARPSTQILAKDYLVQKPGYSYMYTNKSRQVKPDAWNEDLRPVGRTLIQFEEKVKLGSLTSVPSRFTKEQAAAYWGPTKDMQMRYHVSDFNLAPDNMPYYKDFVWAIGHQAYSFDGKNPIQGLRSLDPSKLSLTYLYKQTNPKAPTYVMFKNELTAPYIYDSAEGNIGIVDVGEYANPQLLKSCAGENPCPNHHWRMRVENDTVSINGSRYKYSGPAVRVDYLEISPNDPNVSYRKNLGPHIIRESWYYVKNVGLVKVESKTFNRWGGSSSTVSPSSLTDPDFMAERMSKPTGIMELDSYDMNPKLSATLAKIGGASPGSTLNLSKAASEGYQVKLDPPVTGWLESRMQTADGQWQSAKKWLWAENGLVTVTPEVMKNVPANSYTTQLRIWVPDEQFPNEQRITDTDVPWSNTIKVIVK